MSTLARAPLKFSAMQGIPKLMKLSRCGWQLPVTGLHPYFPQLPRSPCTSSGLPVSRNSCSVARISLLLCFTTGREVWGFSRSPSHSCWMGFCGYHSVPSSEQKSGIKCQIEDQDDPVVSSEWLAKRLGEVCLLDARGHVKSYLIEEGVEKSNYEADYDEYLEGHIPGAVFFNWVKDGIDNESSVPAQLMTDTNSFAAVMEAKGVSTDKPVVIYDKGDGLLAPRLWWALVRHGHPCVRILDGGFRKWVDEGRSVELYEPCTLKVYADYVPVKPHRSLVTSWEEVLSKILSTDVTTMVDARDSAQYAGQIRRSKRAGRIPKAINIPRRVSWTRILLQSFLSSDGTYKSVDSCRQVFMDAGLNPDVPTNLVAYCNGGVASCTVLLSWHRVQGTGAWSNYDGSWNEWGNRDDLPVEM